MLSQTTTHCVLLLVAIFGLACANAQRTADSSVPDTMKLAEAFLKQNAANLAAAKKILAQVRDAGVSAVDKEVAVQVGIQQVRLPLIAEFRAAALDSALAVTAKPTGAVVNGTNGTAATTAEPCEQKTHDQALQELAKFPWGLKLEQYRELCNREPTNEIACFEKLRNFKLEDYEALKEAKELGIELKMPCVPKKKSADYEVGDPFNVTSSGIARQFEGAKKLKVLQDKLAALKRPRTTTTTEATTTETTDTTTTRITQPGETTVATTTTTRRATPAPTAPPSNRPTIRRVGQTLQLPAGVPNAGRTIYFLPQENANAQQCTGGCASIWIPINGERAVDWDLDAAAACAGSGANTIGAAASAASQSGLQLTCGDKLLYLFTEDTKAGDTRGLQFNGLPFRLA